MRDPHLARERVPKEIIKKATESRFTCSPLVWQRGRFGKEIFLSSLKGENKSVKLNLLLCMTQHRERAERIMIEGMQVKTGRFL